MLNYFLRSKDKNKDMFRKLVSNLPFSPALVGQLGFYARRLKKEEVTRRLGLIVTALALVVQSFAVFSPPESANAANNSDFIRGGVSSRSEILDVYDRSAKGNGDFKDIMDYAGVTRAELSKVELKTLNSQSEGKGKDAWQTWGRVHRFSASQGEVKHVVPQTSGGTSTVYSKPFWLYDTTSWSTKHGSDYKAYIGYSKKIGKFAIMKDCGNLITTTTPKPAPEGSFIAATCETIKGSAFDARNTKEDVKVYLYFNGPPGKGEKAGPITASGSNNTFTYAVPQKYKTSTGSTKVWGVLVPLAGWNDNSVQFKNTATIPGNCVKPQPKPMSACATLQGRLIERTKYSLVAKSSAESGAKITTYVFTVKDSSGKVVQTKTVNSTATQVDSGTITLATAGTYSADVVVKTSEGDRSGAGCTTTLKVAAPEMCALNPSLPKSSPDCKPCEGNSQIWYQDAACRPETAQSKEAKNLTQNADASTVVAQASDRIEYTVYIENVGEVPAAAPITEELTDVMEYATLQDNGGGTYNADTHTLNWASVTLQPGEKASRTFVVKVNDKIATTAEGQSEPGSYDCVMTNAFGNTVNVRVACEAPKVLEQTVSELPKTGPTENLIFAGILAALVTYFWARSRQMGKEVRLIRKDFNSGTL